jgi:hypothetical protein
LFKPSTCFLGDYNVPCLVAELKNSDVLGLAKTYIKKTGKDPVFAVYLRVKDSKKPSTWMQKKLNQLFEQDGLTAAVVEGFKELPEDSFDYMDEDKQRDIKAHGYQSYVYVELVVIDEVSRKVLIEISDTFHFIEHGCCIYHKAGRWHLGDSAEYIAYASAFDKQRIGKEIDSSSQHEFEQKWDSRFPPPKKSTIEADASVIFGVWQLDKAATLKLHQEFNASPEEIDAVMVQKVGLYFSPDSWENLSSAGYSTDIWPIVSYERRESWVMVTMRMGTDDSTQTSSYWCDGKQLVKKWSKYVYVRATDGFRKGMRFEDIINMIRSKK